jgi:hypothetical protein
MCTFMCLFAVFKSRELNEEMQLHNRHNTVVLKEYNILLQYSQQNECSCLKTLAKLQL